MPVSYAYGVPPSHPLAFQHHPQHLSYEHGNRLYRFGDVPPPMRGEFEAESAQDTMVKHGGSVYGGAPPPGSMLEHRRSMGMIAAPQHNAPMGLPPSGGTMDNMMSSGSPGDQRPTYIGYIKSAHDAILLLSACDLPANPPTSSGVSSGLRNNAVSPPSRVTRRLLDAERADMVASGCVFAWDEKEAGMKRWTDGRVWSASRVSGCFLTYRELEARKKSNGAAHDGPTSNQYKPEGLIKQSFSVTTASGRKLHVISYFTKRDVREGRLRRVSEDPRFVGEGGGEWGLVVDEKEYSFPDGNHRPPQTVNESSHPGGMSQNDNEADDEVENDLQSDSQSDSGRGDESGVERCSPPTARVQSNAMLVPTLHHNPRKRSMPDESDIDQAAEPALKRPPVRPTLSRMRSSSLSITLSSENVGAGSKPDSAQSSSSNGTTVASEAPEHSSAFKLFAPSRFGGEIQRPHPVNVRSSAIRALVSPTLPRESAIRGSACDMQPTQSQDNANAVGALLSLAGNRIMAAANKKGPSPLSAVGGDGDGGDLPSPTSSVSGLGLTVRPVPERRDLDRDALNMFSLRL